MDDIIHIKLKKATLLTYPTYWEEVEYKASEEMYSRISELLEREVPRQNNISSKVTGYRIVIDKSRAVWQEKTEYAKEVRLEKDPPIEYDISEDLYNIILGVLEKEGKKLYDGPHREMD